MSEDRLDRALQEMQHEAVDAATLDAVRTRVWNKLPNTAPAGCAEFLPDFHAYLSGAVSGGRRVFCWKTTSAAVPRVARRWPR